MEITDLKPQNVWRCFYALTQIPRPSGHTEAVANYLLEFGKQHCDEAFIDNAGNVVMRKKATPGYENRETVILQAHMDMVPQKTNDSNHNFETDPIQTWIDGDWVRAKGTTLGADDGMGVAIAMAVVEDDSLEHGAIEVLITRDEETGMYGAFDLAPETLKGKYLLNIDSETEGEITIGCAGGLDVVCTLDYKEQPVEAPESVAYRINVKGLLGGHSGLEINEGRANANKLMARVLFATVNTGLAQLCSWHGGNMRNAIPRDGEAVVTVSKACEEEFKSMVGQCAKTFNQEYRDIEKEEIIVTATPCDMPATKIPADIQSNLIDAVLAAHDGVLRNIPTIPEIVETSSNLAIISVADGHASVQILARSSMDSMKLYLCNSLRTCFAMAGMKVEFEGGYNGWLPNTKSPFVKEMSEVYEKMYGEKPKILVVHAGLECGIIGPKYPEMDMASIGPTLRSPHTPNERCHIPSVGKSYDYVVEVIKNIPVKA